MKIVVVFLFALLNFAIAGWGPATIYAAARPVVQDKTAVDVSAAEPNKEDITEGLQWDFRGIRLTLLENPSTGYGYEVHGLAGQDVLQCALDQSIYTGAKDCVGAPYARTWFFLFQKDGEAELVFDYCRPFQENSSIHKVILKVHNDAKAGVSVYLNPISEE